MPMWYALIRRPLAYLQTVLGVNVFSYLQPRRGRFWLRAALYVALSLALCYLSQHYLYPLEVTSPLDSLKRLSTQLIQYALVFATVWLLYDITPWTAFSLTSAGYCAQTIAGGVKSLLRLIPFVEALAQSYWMLGLDVVAYFGTYYVLWRVFNEGIRKEGELDNRRKAAFSISVLLMTVFVGRLNQDFAPTSPVNAFAESVFAIMIAVLVLMLLFGSLERTRLEQDVDAMRELVHEQHEQYRHSKQSVELVNQKYHDLKGLLENFSGGVSEAEIAKLRAKLGEYESHVETGSRVLDIVLTEKRAICAARNINFTSFADGHGLEYVEELDLYSLVGNALNNAIDAVSKLPEGERYIILKLATANGMTTLHVENPYAGELVMENDLPKSQRDGRYHGFGVRSMGNVCEKYGGTLAVRAENGVFALDAILLAA